MNAVAMIEEIVREEGHDYSVVFDEEGRLKCNIDGQLYSPFQAANQFVTGGWQAVWKD